MSLPYMPFFVADHLADTLSLTTLEHGAYTFLIFEYWRRGRLPTDDQRLARIARLTDEEWQSIRNTMVDFFDEEWRHRRIDAELMKAKAKSESARASANRRWKGVTGDDGSMRTHMLSHSEGNAKAMHPYPYPESAYPSRDRTAAKRRSRIAIDAAPTASDETAATKAGLRACEAEIEWRKFRDHHLSKGSLMLDWSAAWRSWLGRRQEWAAKGVRPLAAVGHESNFTKAARKLLGELEEASPRARATTSLRLVDMEANELDPDEDDEEGLRTAA